MKVHERLSHKDLKSSQKLESVENVQLFFSGVHHRLPLAFPCFLFDCVWSKLPASWLLSKFLAVLAGGRS